MTLQSFVDTFIKKYLGKQVEYHSFGGTDTHFQCVDLVNQYIKELGLTPVIGTNAKDFPSKVSSKEFEVLKNTPDFKPIVGDIAIWSGAVGGGSGHIAIVRDNKATLSMFNSVDQNWSRTKYVTLESHSYKNVTHFLRPIQKRVGNPPDMPKTYTQEQWDKLNLENTDNWNKWKKAENDLVSLRHENQDNWDKWQAELKKAAKLQSDLDGANAKADQRKKEYETLLETLAKKLTLPATSDISDIMGAIERLLSVEELLRKAEKDLAKQQEKHDQEKEQFIRDIEALRGAIDKQQKENETLLARINDLEKRLEAREEAIKMSSRFSIFLEKVLRIFK
jgi:hypothetical protein